MYPTQKTVEAVCQGAKRRRLKAKIVLELGDGGAGRTEDFVFDGADANAVCFRERGSDPPRLVVYTIGRDVTLFADGTGVLAEALPDAPRSRSRPVVRVANVHYPVF